MPANFDNQKRHRSYPRHNRTRLSASAHLSITWHYNLDYPQRFLG